MRGRTRAIIDLRVFSRQAGTRFTYLNCIGVTLSSDRSSWPCRALSAHRTGDSLRPGRALCSGCSRGSSRTRGTSGSAWYCKSQNMIGPSAVADKGIGSGFARIGRADRDRFRGRAGRARGTCGAGFACGSRCACGSGRTDRAGGASRSCGAGRAVRSRDPLRPRRANAPRRTGIALWPGRTGGAGGPRPGQRAAAGLRHRRRTGRRARPLTGRAAPHELGGHRLLPVSLPLR